jgi:phosphatidylinositol-3-phosphatase
MKTTVCAIAMLLACLSGSAGAAPSPAALGGTGCGSLTASPVHVTKVLTIVNENTDLDQIVGSTQAPNMNALIDACGLATDYHGIQFPSLPNYIALTSGEVPPSIGGDGVMGRDCKPSATCQSTDPSIFDQIDATTGGAGPLSWRTYAESMPKSCTRTNVGEYVARHNPAVYYPDVGAACAQFDLPSGSPASGALASDLAAGTLPSYSLLIPNLCNDGHDSCNGVPRVAEQDATVGAWMTTILASPDYRSGRLLVVITADTSQSAANGNLLTTILVNPDIPAATTATARFDHYSLLRLDEELLGLPPLANAAGAADMAPAFNLPLPR